MKKNSAIKTLVQAMVRQKAVRSAAALFCGFKTQTRLLPGPEMHTLIWTEPRNVRLCIRDTKKYRLKINGFVRGGAWDTKGTAPIQEVRPVICETIEQLFVHELDFRETTQYRLMKERILLGKTTYWCSTLEDLDTYFTILLSAYSSIKKYGFKTQAELSASDPDKIRRKGREDEIQVYLGRNGQLILGRGGTHRLLMAGLLNLERIPVQVRLVHKNWARKCFEESPEKKLEKSLRLCLENMDLNGKELA